MTRCSTKFIDNKNGAGATSNNGNVDYLGLRVWMKPATFLALAPPLSRENAGSADGLVEHMQAGGKVASPMLDVSIPGDWEDSDLREPARVTGHEGRNRMYALAEICGPDVTVEVHIFPRGLRARHLTPVWVEALRESMLAQDYVTSRHHRGKLIPGPLFTIDRPLASNRRRSSKGRRRSSRQRR